MKFIGLFFLVVFSAVSIADNIGLGEVVAVKQYDFGTGQYVRIYLDASATHQKEECIVEGKVMGQITHSKHEEAIVNRMFSLATAAYMSGKKIRLYSESNSCEIDFVALQETEF